MARRYVGDAFIDITFRPGKGKGDYAGHIRVGRHVWPFAKIYLPVPHKYGANSDSPSAFDDIAKAAVSFGGFYNNLNRPKKIDRWAPPVEVADAIYQATSHAIDDRGRYAVRRTLKGTPRWK
jgi:hypothetical protein